MSVTDPRALGPRRDRVAFHLITRFGLGRICDSVGPLNSEPQVGGVPIRVGGVFGCVWVAGLRTGDPVWSIPVCVKSRKINTINDEEATHNPKVEGQSSTLQPHYN
jgi:hypothetical protein